MNLSCKRVPGVSWLCLAGFLAGSLSLALAAEDDTAMGRRLQEALRAQRGEVHACYAQVLARDPRAQGELLVQVQMGQGGRVSAVEILKDETNQPQIASCLTERMRRWSLPQLQADPGDKVVFPLIFHPDDVKSPLPPPRGPAPVIIPKGADTGGKKADPAAAVQVDERISVRSHRDTRGALSILTLAPKKTHTFHRHAGLEVLYVLSGTGEVVVEGAKGGKAQKQALAEGEGVAISPGFSHKVSAGAAPLVLYQVRAPDVGDPPLGEPPPAKADKRKEGGLLHLQAPKAVPVSGGKCQARVLLTGEQAVSLTELVCEEGAGIPLHKHDTSDELLFIEKGRGLMDAGTSRGMAVVAGDAVRVPAAMNHGLVVKEKMRAIQSYAPAGPEARFLTQEKTPAK